MAGPWEKYQQAPPPQEEGPWTKYQANPSKSDQPSEGLGSKLLGLVVAGAKKFDSYTGAPTRAAISAAQDAQNPVSAFAHQFGENPDSAPTGETIVKKAGVPEGIPSKVAGFAMDMAANPLNFTGPVAAVAGKTLGAAREIPYAGAAIGAIADFPGKAATKVAAKVTGVPEQAIKNYAQDVHPVNDFIADTGGEVSAGADQMKARIMQNIQTEKNVLNDQIKTALSNADPDRTVSSAPVLEQLQKIKASLNKHTQAADFAHIQNQIDTVQAVAPNGQMSLQNLFDVKQYLQTQAYGSFRGPSGDIFLVSDQAKRAAKAAFGVAKDALHTEAPAIKDADEAFSFLHGIDDTMSGSLLKQGVSENTFASAGGGTNKYANQNYTALKKIGEATGTNPLEDARTVYTAQSLNKNPSIAKEAFKTALTVNQGASEAGIPGRSYNVIQVLGNPDIPLQQSNQNTAIHRRLGSQRK